VAPEGSHSPILTGMLAMLLSALLTGAGALLVGQLALRLCGATTWNWLAAPVGLAVLMLVCVPALHVPGRATTTAVLALLLIIAGIMLMVREPAQRPPLTGVLAAAPVALLALVPFLSAGRAGTLGVTVNNDMAAHLIWADAYRSQIVEQINTLPSDYPLGPHALAASLAQGLGARVDYTFAGLTIALPILLAWTALGALKAAGLLRSAALALIVGIPFVVAGYYGQGSFKELMEGMFALAVVVFLSRGIGDAGRGLLRWTPLGLLLAGTLSVYGGLGLVWPLTLIGAWLVVLGALTWWNHGTLRSVVTGARREVVPILVGTGITLVLLIPQIPRLGRFLQSHSGEGGTGIADSNLGNLLGRIPVWLGFGVWDQPDYRLPAIDPFTVGMWTAFVIGLALVGVIWCVRRGQWVIPLAAVLFLLIWAYSDATQSPYVAAKAIAILSPTLLLLAALPVVDGEVPGLPSPSWWRMAAPILATVLVFKVAQSSWHALRITQVGATAHADELESLRPMLQRQRVMFLGNDDFHRWELAGAYAIGPVLGVQNLPIRPEKPWAQGDPIDFDSLPPELYNGYDWVISPRDAAGSSPPAGLRLVRRTRTFDLYRRVGVVPARRVLAEGSDAGRVLNCSTRTGRALARRSGVALVRERPLAVSVPGLLPGGSETVKLPLTPGTWDLELPYVSQRPLEVRAAGRTFELPASMDRPGVRLPAGAITVTRTGPVAVTVRSKKNALTPRSALAIPLSVLATRRGTERMVPLREACGRYVDWYELRRPQPAG